MNKEMYASEYEFDYNWLKRLKNSMPESYREHKYDHVIVCLKGCLGSEKFDDATKVSMAMAMIQAFLDLEEEE